MSRQYGGVVVKGIGLALTALLILGCDDSSGVGVRDSGATTDLRSVTADAHAVTSDAGESDITSDVLMPADSAPDLLLPADSAPDLLLPADSAPDLLLPADSAPDLL
ncbi:MAG: hypothetical protein JRH20_04000, partial [Deltaproteobacteria bacterium]|nr:hypothetical protein [Deltaproteobacteria bacterium]